MWGIVYLCWLTFTRNVGGVEDISRYPQKKREGRIDGLSYTSIIVIHTNTQSHTHVVPNAYITHLYIHTHSQMEGTCIIRYLGARL